jgi:hypothetical protein
MIRNLLSVICLTMLIQLHALYCLNKLRILSLILTSAFEDITVYSEVSSALNVQTTLLCDKTMHICTSTSEIYATSIFRIKTSTCKYYITSWSEN